MNKLSSALAVCLILSLFALVVYGSEAEKYRMLYHRSLVDQYNLQVRHIRMLQNYSRLQDSYIELYGLIANYTSFNATKG